MSGHWRPACSMLLRGFEDPCCNLVASHTYVGVWMCILSESGLSLSQNSFHLCGIRLCICALNSHHCSEAVSSMFTDSQCLCSFQTRPSISRPANLKKLAHHQEKSDTFLSQNYLTEPEITTHSPIQDCLQRASVQVQCPLLLQGTHAHI